MNFSEAMSYENYLASDFHTNCVNNKMLEYDWFLTAHIYSLILLCNSKTVRFDLSDYKKLVIGQVKSDS